MKDKGVEQCEELDTYHSELLASQIIDALKRSLERGADRKDRVTAPSGAVILF